MKMGKKLTGLTPIVSNLDILAQDNKPAQKKHEPITQQLITMVEHNLEIKKLLVKSIEKAKEINSDRATNPAQTLEEYYTFIDWAAKSMPLSIIPNISFPKLYEQIDQSLNYFYFINDQEHKELADKGYYNNSLQYHEPYRTWLINFIKEWGIYLSKEDSWNDFYYKEALKDERFGIQKGWYENPSRWKTFNDFFSRFLKSPAQRPIASPNNPSIVVSPADSTPQGVWRIDKNSNFVPNDGVTIKSNVFKSIKVLIGEDSDYKNEFANGTLTHTFLDVNDYHRFHFPISGTIKEVRIILGDDAIGGSIKWNAELNKYILDSKDPGWQNVETRGCVIIENEKYGLVAVLPIGMSQISSVNFEKNVTQGKKVKKGDMAGYFLFGGSDFVVIFQNKVDFKLIAPKDENNNYKHLLMGEEYGRITLKK